MLTPEDDAYWREYHVTPRYLAGSLGVDEDPSLRPFVNLNWSHHQVDDDLGKTVFVSPDGRLRIGFFGDDYILWNVAAYEDPFGPRRWAATFNQNTPPEIVAAFTTALAHDYEEGNDHFLARPAVRWDEQTQPLTEAGWARDPSAKTGTVEIIAPDKLAGIFLDIRCQDPEDEQCLLWSGPPGWGTRAEATFTTHTPAHLIAATAAAMADPAPLVRYERSIPQELRDLVQLTPVEPPPPPKPTPLDVRRTAVSLAVERAFRSSPTDPRAVAALARTTLPSPTRSAGSPAPQASPPGAHLSPTRPGPRR
ncbi:DUF317 domain-containing protein [Streptomyces phaeolivaceus]|uniref:DUF317 domain-containing protein n=1 Tax=Streptomyces phaeolivaceus TaxID=2653200 RepID=A0A5P8K8K6_9ACTN|nr:DUF317 domain-containing protein [Streptomyces phaeolivaceus]QFQ99326.1 DUF317 domain-containing protein [Streptomyces phaeolivaceus]